MDKMTRKCWKIMFDKTMSFIIDLRQVAKDHDLTDTDVIEYIKENMSNLSHIQNWVELSHSFDYEFGDDDDDDIDDTLS